MKPKHIVLISVIVVFAILFIIIFNNNNKLVGCPEDARICPDGTAVVRVSPN